MHRCASASIPPGRSEHDACIRPGAELHASPVPQDASPPRILRHRLPCSAEVCLSPGENTCPSHLRSRFFGLDAVAAPGTAGKALAIAAGIGGRRFGRMPPGPAGLPAVAYRCPQQCAEPISECYLNIPILLIALQYVDSLTSGKFYCGMQL